MKHRSKNQGLERVNNRDSLVSVVSRFRILPVLTIVGFGLLAYSNTFESSFHFDDETSITANADIHDLGNLQAIWHHSPTRFITYLSFAINYHVHQLSVLGYHLVNLLVHLGAALCVWWLLRLTLSTPVLRGKIGLREGRWLALLGGLVFVTHPLQTQAVTYIVQRATSLAALCYLASLALYVKGRLTNLQNAPKRAVIVYFSASAALALCAMFSKEIAYTLPLAVLLYESCFFKGEQQPSARYLFAFLTLLLLVPVVLWRLNMLPIADTGLIPRSQYLMTQFRVLTLYLLLLIVPAKQNFDYDFPLSRHFFEPATLGSVALLLLILIIAVLLFRKYRLVAFGIFWFFLTLTPESSIIPIRDVVFEHRLYLPMFGFCATIVGILIYFFATKHFQKVVAISLAVILIYSGASYKRNEVWRDEITLWTDVISKSPNKARAYNDRGRAYLDRGQHGSAIADFNKAVALDRSLGEAYSNRGNVNLALEQYVNAIGDYENAIRAGLSYQQDYSRLYYNLGTALLRLSRFDEAIENFTKAIAQRSNDAQIYYNRAIAYQSKGKYVEALLDYDKAIEIHPSYSKAYNNRAVIEQQSGKSNEALVDYGKAISFDPNFHQAFFGRGLVYTTLGEYGKAIQDFTMIIQLSPNDPDAYNQRGLAFHKNKEYDKALNDFETALKLNALYAEAHYNKGLALLSKGDVKEAQKSFQNAKAMGYRPKNGIVKQASK